MLVTRDYYNPSEKWGEKWHTGLGFLPAKGHTYTITIYLPNAQDPVTMGNKVTDLLMHSEKIHLLQKSPPFIPSLSTGHNWSQDEAEQNLTEKGTHWPAQVQCCCARVLSPNRLPVHARSPRSCSQSQLTSSCHSPGSLITHNCLSPLNRLRAV